MFAKRVFKCALRALLVAAALAAVAVFVADGCKSSGRRALGGIGSVGS
jgi:hypothetical protein